MAKLENVLSVYTATTVKVVVNKVKRTDYAKGGFVESVTKTETTESQIFAFLGCGHTRGKHPHEDFNGSRKLSCHQCGLLNYRPDDEYHLRSAKENLELVASHKAQGFLNVE